MSPTTDLIVDSQRFGIEEMISNVFELADGDFRAIDMIGVGLENVIKTVIEIQKSVK